MSWGVAFRCARGTDRDGSGVHIDERQVRSSRNLLCRVDEYLPVPRKTWQALVVAFMTLAVAGCGGVEDKVSNRLDREIRSCRAVGKTELGKIYLCQTEGTTVCVAVDGDDVFNAYAEAQRAGIGC